MFRKLHIGLTLYMAVILTFFMVFITTSIYYFTRIVYEDQALKLMKEQAIKVYNYNTMSIGIMDIITQEGFATYKSSLAFIERQKVDCDYVYYDNSMNILFGKESDSYLIKSIANLAEQSLKSKKDSYTKQKIKNVSFRIYTKYVEGLSGPGVIQVYESASGEYYIWSFLKTVLCLSGFGGILILLAISYVFTGKALQPVKEAWNKQKEFVADASHELRTPLTVIQTNLDVMMSDDAGTIEENIMWLDNAYSETRVMAKLIDQLLTLAKVDSNDTELDFIDLSLSEIAENVTDNMKIMAKNKNLNLVTDIKDNVIIRGDYDKIRRLIVILVDNAIKYTESGEVIVKVYTEKSKKIISVEDTGIGISEEEQKRIYDRFFRSDKARNRKFGGTGLGLSIAKWIIDSHKATIDVNSKIGEGTIFIVKFS